MKIQSSPILNSLYKNIFRDSFFALFVTLSIFAISQVDQNKINAFTTSITPYFASTAYAQTSSTLDYYGYVTDKNGTPLSGVQVTTVLVAFGSYSTTTDATGKYYTSAPYGFSPYAIFKKDGYTIASLNLNSGIANNFQLSPAPLIMSPSEGTFNMQTGNTLTFNLTNVTAGNLETCYEVVNPPLHDPRIPKGYCDNPNNFFSF